MKINHFYSIIYSTLFLLIIGCTNKEINLITNIDFELNATNETSGFVKDTLSTSIVLTPENTDYPGFSYYVNYTIAEGKGYFITEDGTQLTENTDFSVYKDQGFETTWHYIGTEPGIHQVIVNGKDNFNRSKTKSLTYDLKVVELFWEATSPQTMAIVNDTIPFNLVLENRSEGQLLTFEQKINIADDIGLILDTDKKPLVLNQTLPVTEGTLNWFYVGKTIGQHTIQFDLEASNDLKKTTSISFDFKEALKNDPPTVIDDIAETFATVSVTIDALVNDTDPEQDVLSLTSVSVPTNGVAQIVDGQIVYTPNQNFVGKEVFEYTITDTAGNETSGLVTITVKLRETITIIDPNFEQALIDLNMDYDDVVDTKIFKDIAEKITILDVSNKNISDLTGIEGFVNLETLTANKNNLTNVNISDNVKLKILNLDENKIANIDLTNNIQLEEIMLYNNDLSTINLSQNTLLKTLDLDRNNLTSIDISNNPLLELLDVQANKLSTLDLTNNKNILRHLAVGNRNDATNKNTISNLNLSQFSSSLEVLNINRLPSINNMNFRELVNLKALYCSGSGFTNLDLTNNLFLEQLGCGANKLTEIDLSKNTELFRLQIEGNNLTQLDVSNNTKLNRLHLYGSRLKSLDLTKNLEIQYLSAPKNNFTELDFSNNSKMIHIDLRENNITTLDLSKLNLSLLDELVVEDTPSLTCIKVTDIEIANNKTNWSKDVTAIYSLNCN